MVRSASEICSMSDGLATQRRAPAFSTAGLTWRGWAPGVASRSDREHRGVPVLGELDDRRLGREVEHGFTERLVEEHDRARDLGGSFVARDDHPVVGGVERRGEQCTVRRTIGLVDEHVEAGDQVGGATAIGRYRIGESPVGTLRRCDGQRLGGRVDTHVVGNAELSGGLDVATAEIEHRGHAHGIDEALEQRCLELAQLASGTEPGPELGIERVAGVPEDLVHEAAPAEGRLDGTVRPPDRPVDECVAGCLQETGARDPAVVVHDERLTVHRSERRR